MTAKRFDWDLNGIWDYQSDSDEYLESSNEICEILNELHEENQQLKQYKEAIWNCDSSKIIRVNMNTGEVDLIDKELEE